jgi:hypothetical protein
MQNLCITVRQPGARVRGVVVIIIYLTAFRLAPHADVPLALGGLLGGWLAAEPRLPRLSYAGREGVATGGLH